MYTGFDVNLPDEDFRDTDPPSMGSVCAVPRARVDRGCCRLTSIFPARWAGAKRARRPARTAGFWAGSYDPFCTECTAFVDHPPDDIWKPQVVRGEPHLASTSLPEAITLDRLQDRRRLVDAVRLASS